MKNFRSFFKIASLLLLVCWITIYPQSETPFSINEAPIPNNGQPVHDYANVIDDATEQQINQKIKDFMARTNPPVVLAVLTVKTTGDRPIEEYAIAIYRGWKIGAAGEDSPGALLLVAIDDRKYRTEISRDLEDELPDGLAGQLQRQYLVPAFRQGDYSKGIADTIDAYIRTIEARLSGTMVTPTPLPGQTPRGGSGTSSSFSLRSICCLIGLIVLMIIIFSRAGGGGGRNNRRGGGGGFGGGGSALPWIIGSIIANSAGSRGDSSWGGGGSSWGGGDFGGGGGWGGFGGGGDAGGGGAGGDW